MADQAASNHYIIKAKNFLGQNWAFFVAFSFFFALLRVSPMAYDGWGGTFVYRWFAGPIHWLLYLHGPNRSLCNSRIASNFFCGMLESFDSELPLDFAAALVLVGIIWCLLHLFRIQKKTLPTLAYTAMIVFMPYLPRTYVIQIALLPYITPVFLTLAALILLERYREKNCQISLAALFPLSAIACTWMENSSLAYGVVLAADCLYIMVRRRKIDWKLCALVVVAALSGLYMVTSPGMVAYRSAPGGSGLLTLSSSRILSHTTSYFDAYIYQGGMFNLILFILLLLPCAARTYDAIRKREKRYALLYAALTLANTTAVLGFCKLCKVTGEYSYVASLNKGYFQTILEQVPYGSTGFLLGYGLLLAANFLLLCQVDRRLLLTALFGIASFGVILLSSQVGERIYSPCFFTIVCLGCVALGENQELLNIYRGSRRVTVGVMAVLMFLTLDFQSQLCQGISITQAQREERIELLREQQIQRTWDPDAYYYLPAFSTRQFYRGGSLEIGEYHYPYFLTRYGLLPNTKILFTTETSYLTAESYDKDGMTVMFHDNSNQERLYTFTVSYRKDAGEEWSEILSEENRKNPAYHVPAVNGAGDYRVQVTLYSESAGTSTVFAQTVEHTFYSEE